MSIAFHETCAMILCISCKRECQHLEHQDECCLCVGAFDEACDLCEERNLYAVPQGAA